MMATPFYKHQLNALVVSRVDGYIGQIVMESGRGTWADTFPPAKGTHYRVDWGGRLPPDLYESAKYYQAVKDGVIRPSFYPSPHIPEYGAVIYESWEAEHRL